MRGLLASLCVLSAMSAPAFALETNAAKDKAQFLKLETQLWDAWNAHLKPSEAAPFYSHKPDNLYFDLSPLKFQGWAEYERTAAQALAGGGYAKTVINDKDFTVIRNGDLVVTAFTFHVDFHGPKGAPQGFTGRETDVWTRENGRWVVLHQHMSTPMGGH